MQTIIDVDEESEFESEDNEERDSTVQPQDDGFLTSSGNTKTPRLVRKTTLQKQSPTSRARRKGRKGKRQALWYEDRADPVQ